jgi:hypothetical protein
VRRPRGAIHPPRLALACLALILASALSPPASAARISGDTYCVGPRGTPDACDSAEIRAQHHPSCWHDHGEALHGPGNAYTDGRLCYVCYDECDSTCDLIFLSDNPGWEVVPELLCGSRLPWAPLSEGVQHHVIDGSPVKLPPPPPPSEPEEVVLRLEINVASSGPFAVGASVDLEISLRGPAGEPRGFGRGQLIVTDPAGQEIQRRSVDASGNDSLRVALLLEREGAIKARFEPDIRDISLGPDEKLSVAPSGLGLELTVATCTYRARLIDPPVVTLPGRPLPVVVWVVDGVNGTPVAPGDYRGPPVSVTLRLPGGEDVVAPAEASAGEWHASLDLPELQGGSVSGQLSASGAADGVALCPEDVAVVEVAPLGVILSVSAPPRCYLTKPCEVSWVVSFPAAGPAAELARSFLGAAEIEGSVGGQPLDLRGSVASGSFSAVVIPDHVGMAFFRLEVRSGDDAIEASASVDVRSDIVLSLPSSIDLGELVGGSDWEDTCVPLDFAAAGNRGAFLAPFVVELEQEEDCACEGRPTLALTVLDPAAGAGGLWVAEVTEDPATLPGLYRFEARGGLEDNDALRAGAEGRPAMAVCLSGLGRCPTAGEGSDRTLVIRPAVPEFADQVARVQLRYRIADRSFLACWGDLLALLSAGFLGLFVVYGFVRPHSFSPADRIRIAGDDRGLSRAPKVPLRQFPAGRRGWYRSGRASVGAGGARLRSPRRAVFVVRATPAGPMISARGALRMQNSRTRRSEVIEESSEGVLMRNGVVYEVGDLFVRVG